MKSILPVLRYLRYNIKYDMASLAKCFPLVSRASFIWPQLELANERFLKLTRQSNVHIFAISLCFFSKATDGQTEIKHDKGETPRCISITVSGKGYMTWTKTTTPNYFLIALCSRVRFPLTMRLKQIMIRACRSGEKRHRLGLLSPNPSNHSYLTACCVTDPISIIFRSAVFVKTYCVMLNAEFLEDVYSCLFVCFCDKITVCFFCFLFVVVLFVFFFNKRFHHHTATMELGDGEGGMGWGGVGWGGAGVGWSGVKTLTPGSIFIWSNWGLYE